MVTVQPKVVLVEDFLKVAVVGVSYLVKKVAVVEDQLEQTDLTDPVVARLLEVYLITVHLKKNILIRRFTIIFKSV